jgi:hypothetical protein
MISLFIISFGISSKLQLIIIFAMLLLKINLKKYNFCFILLENFYNFKTLKIKEHSLFLPAAKILISLVLCVIK